MAYMSINEIKDSNFIREVVINTNEISELLDDHIWRSDDFIVCTKIIMNNRNSYLVRGTKHEILDKIKKAVQSAKTNIKSKR